MNLKYIFLGDIILLKFKVFKLNFSLCIESYKWLSVYIVSLGVMYYFIFFFY